MLASASVGPHNAAYNTPVARNLDPYALICNPDKTTITCPGGIALGYGSGPGLRNAIFWNRIGSLFSCYRPAVAVLNVFDTRDLRHPLALKSGKTHWEPNLVTAHYSAGSLRIEERRTALKAGLRYLLKLRSLAKGPRDLVLFFHGQVVQQPFFDYRRDLPEPLIQCEFEPHLRRIKLIQPHPHSGLGEVNSIQTVTASHRLDAFGFGADQADLHALWQDHGALACLRLRLGQVGGRLLPPDRAEGADLRFQHHHPLYYFALKVRLEPGDLQLVSIATQYHTDDEGGKLPGPYDGTAPDEWQEYLRVEVPQLDCDDLSLLRYWYYVWYLLLANRTARGGHIKHRFTAPSKYMYWGPWIWDGYFHVLGEMWQQHTETARDSIRAVLDMQFPNGYLPVCSGSQYRMCFHEDIDGYTSPTGGGYASYIPSELRDYVEGEHPFEATTAFNPVSAHPERLAHNEKTQTPLITVAAAEYCELHQDRDFAAEVLPALLSYDDWLWSRRTDKQGRFILWHGDESGWDNATRHYPVPAKPFDVQVHCLLHREALLSLMRFAARPGDEPHQRQAEIAKRARMTRKALKTYWDTNDRWHYDFAASGDGSRSGKRRKQIAASGLYAMLAVDSTQVTEACLNALSHERVFATKYPIPSLAKCDPDYAPRSWGWNGPAWLQVNYFTIVGLLRQRQYQAAFDLWEKTKRLVIQNNMPSEFELYDPETGLGLGCPDYSWQAMLNHLVIRYFAGVGCPHLRPALPPGLSRLKLSNLPGAIESIALRRRGRTVQIDVQYSAQGHSLCESLRPGWGSFPLLIPDGLGEIASISGNGWPFIQQRDWWEPSHQAGPSRTWEIKVSCR